jgi:hypothetical protein
MPREQEQEPLIASVMTRTRFAPTPASLILGHNSAGATAVAATWSPMVPFRSEASSLITREIPRLCRGGSRSLTVPAIGAPRSTDEVRTRPPSTRTKFRRWTGGRASEQYQGLIQRRISESALRHGQWELCWGCEGRLQAAHLSGPRSDPDAASSGPNLKAPGSAGGYLLAA